MRFHVPVGTRELLAEKLDYLLISLEGLEGYRTLERHEKGQSERPVQVRKSYHHETLSRPDMESVRLHKVLVFRVLARPDAEFLVSRIQVFLRVIEPQLGRYTLHFFPHHRVGSIRTENELSLEFLQTPVHLYLDLLRREINLSTGCVEIEFHSSSLLSLIEQQLI